MLSPGDLLVDRFVIQHHAGSGAAGRVYRARDRQTGEAVALKVLHAADMAGMAERFAREARVLSELSHPGIVRYVTHGTTGTGEAYLAMEWLAGETLRDRLSRRELTIKETVELGRHVASALGAMHRSGFVHRDLKPGNLFLLGGEVLAVRVIDFGIARMRGASAEITHTGSMLGTPGYMAPEQARGEPDIDPRADVFALGCVLFRCLTGKPVFEGEDALAVLLKVALEEAPAVRQLRPDVPEALDALVARMLSKDKADRPANGDAVLAELAMVGEIAQDGPAPSDDSPPSITTTERRVVGLIVARVDRPAGSSPGGADDPHAGGLRAIAEQYGGKLDLLADGSILLAFTSERAATDLAARAARCALAVRKETRPSAIALVAGREVLLSGIPMGEVIDRAVRLLAQASVAAGAFSAPRSSPRPEPAPVPIPIDEVIAGLLDARFDVGHEDGLLVLRCERDVGDGGRTLLGKTTPCVGRDRELSLLESLFRETAEEGVARAVLVTGPAGIGKSRLRFEIVKRILASPGPVEVWFARGDPMSAGSPFALLGQAIRRAAGVLEGEPRAVRWQRLHARLARHASGASLERLAELVGELCGVPRTTADRGSRSVLGRRDPVLLGDQMRRAWEDWLTVECAAQPLVLVLEDLHWGDLPTVKFVDAALRNLPHVRLFVLAFGRPEVHGLFPRLWADRRMTELKLEELTRRSSEALVRGVLGDSISAASVARLVERAAGNALYLEELIRAVADGERDALPESVLAMVQARLEELDPESRRLLRAASVFGQSFWEGGVLALLGGKRTPAFSASLETLVHRELLFRRGESRFPGEREYNFRHGLVREAAYGMLTDEDRVLGHNVAGEWLEAHEDGDAAALAEHFERGHQPARAMRWYVRAAEQALGGNDLALVIEAAERGIRCGASREDFALLRLLQAEAHQWRGEHADVARCCTDALANLPRRASLWYRAVAEAARVSGRLGAHAQLQALADELLETPADPAVLPDYVTALAQASTQLMFGGSHALAASLLERAERLSRVVESDPLLLGQMSAARGVRAMCAGDLVGDLTACEAAVAAYEAAGDFRGSCHSLINVGYTCYLLGQHELSVQHLTRALALAERTGTFVLIAFAKHNLGIALARLGQLERAAAVEREAAAAALGQGDVRLETATRVYLSLILAESGDLTGAAEEAANAVAIAAAGSPMMAYALATLASALGAMGRHSEARGHAEAAYRLLTSLGGIDDGDTFVRLVFAQEAMARGDRGAARRAIASARDRTLERAARIGVPAWRETFLSRVPENARTLALAEALAGA